MKKLFIVIVFVFLIAILISFNYLLWDREKQFENFQDLSDSKNLTIDTLSDKMNNLNKLNKELAEKLDKLTKEGSAMHEDILELKDENDKLNLKIETKNGLINTYKNFINTVPIQEVISKWVDAVNSKNYKLAQSLISENSSDEILNNSAKFKEIYQNEIKTISLKSASLYTDLQDDEHLEKIQFKVVFDVIKPANADKTGDMSQYIFKNGQNTKFITIDFHENKSKFTILEINNEP